MSVAAIESLESRRLLALYTLDPTFGDGGQIHIARQTSSVWPAISFVHTLPDGKVLAGGRTSTLGGRVHRFDVTGAPDTTFNGDGATEVVDMFVVNGGAMQSDGKILLLGASPDSIRVARYTADGELDDTFDGDGVADIAGFHADEVALAGRSLAVDSLGRIVVVGEGSIPDSPPQFGVVARLNANGSLDTSFAGDGTFLLDLRGRPNVHADAHTFPDQVAIVDGDKVLVLCQVFHAPDFAAGALVRFNTDGSFDSTFASASDDGGGDGVRIFGFPTGAADDRAVVSALLVQAEDDKIVVGGAAFPHQSDEQAAALIRFHADGTVDTSFGDAGVARAGMREDRVWDLDRDNAGRYVGLLDGAIIRFTPGGADDMTFGNAGYASLPDFQTYEFELDPQGRALIGGLGTVLRADDRPDLALGVNGVLIISAESGNNTFAVAPSGANVVVTRNGVQSTFAADQILKIDVLTGDGNDTVNITFDSSYLIQTGEGTNTVTVADGFLRFNGGAGDDWVTAGNGNAVIDTSNEGAGGGADRVQLGDGDHTIATSGSFGSAGGDDTIITGAGRDSIMTGLGNDWIATGGGAGDVIAARGGDDTITTAAGDDFIEGNFGSDSISAGAGDDVVVGGDAFRGFGGGDDGSNVIDGGDGRDTLAGAGGRDTIRGGAQADVIRGHSGADLLAGNGGKDRIAGEAGRDRIYGGAGDDQLDGGTWADRIFAQAGNDVIEGGNASDLLRGDDGDDRFFSMDGDTDEIDGGAGANVAVLFDEVDELLNVTS